MLVLKASGSITDYSNATGLDGKIAISGKIAEIAEIDTSAVSLTFTAANVLVTATIAVPASTTAAAVQDLLTSALGTASAASEERDHFVPFCNILICGSCSIEAHNCHPFTVESVFAYR